MFLNVLRPPEPEVQIELFRLGHRNLIMHTVGHVVLPLIVAAGARGAVAPSLLRSWLAMVMLSNLVMWLSIWRFRHLAQAPSVPPSTLRGWHLAHMVALCLTGACWGAEGMLLVPSKDVHNLMIMTAFAGVLAYSAASNPAYDLPGFIASMAIGTALMALFIPPAFGEHALYVAGMCAIYMVVLGFVARNAHNTVLTSVRLRLINEALARKSAEQAEKADRANREKSEFLAAASHDLRQPVHALLLLIEAYRQQNPAAAADPLLLHIASAGQSISTLFNALMELSRLETGAEKPLLTEIPLATLMRRCISRYRLDAEDKNLQLRSRIADGLETTLVQSDKVLLERIVGNLLGNALRYTERGGVLLNLRRGHDGGLWLEVWDTGIGIPAEDHERVFQPYYQVGNPERDRGKGLGLGLAIVKQAVQALHIGLSLRSRPFRGSRFRLSFPAWSLASERLPPDVAAPHAPPPGLKGLRLLLVDDDPMVREAMKALLCGWGIDLRMASRGDEGVMNVCNDGWQPECVLCDYRLPGPLNGIAVLAFLQEHFPKAAGLLQTGELAEAVHAEAAEAGYLVLSKPVAPSLLAATLCALLPQVADPIPEQS
ncbi:MAG: ATP-binding protein [Rhodocyclaceae bacterium]|nr:ATP-binding protein [Rhodocyclaceae bacterium]